MPRDTINENWRQWTVPEVKSSKSGKSKKLYWQLQHDGRSNQMMQQLEEQDVNQQQLVVNRYATLWNDNTMQERLRLWGIPVSEQAVWQRRVTPIPSRRYIRTVSYWVYGHDIVLAGLCNYYSMGHHLVQPIKDWNRDPYRRLARIAIKTAYALGYDTLQVTLQAGGELLSDQELPSGVIDEPQAGDVVIHAAPVTEDMGQEVWSLYLARLQQHAKDYYQAEPSKHVMYGMDCEFLLHDSVREKALKASHFLPLSGIAGCDAVRRNGIIIYPLMELRPLPAHTPIQLIEHLRDAMREASKRIKTSGYRNQVSWLGGSYPYGCLPIGCHLHLSAVSYEPEMIRTFDTYAALPLALLEPHLESKRRRPTYGMFGDVRMQDHGGAGGFEYRTLPNFVHTPELAFDIVTLIAILTQHYRKLRRRETTQTEWLKAYIDGSDESRYRCLARELLLEVKRQSDTVEQTCAIQRLIERIERNWKWNEREDLAPHWIT